MNQAWQRLASGVRYNQLKDGKEEMVGNCVERLIQAQIDEGLKAHGDLQKIQKAIEGGDD